MDLDQVDLPRVQPLEGRLDLLAGPGRIGGAAARHVDLGGPEDPVRDAELVRDAAGDLLGGAVAGRRVEDLAAHVDHGFQDLAQRGDVLRARDARERGRAAQADQRQLFAGRRDGAGQQRLLPQSVEEARIQRQRGARAERHSEPIATAYHDLLLASSWSTDGRGDVVTDGGRPEFVGVPAGRAGLSVPRGRATSARCRPSRRGHRDGRRAGARPRRAARP